MTIGRSERAKNLLAASKAYAESVFDRDINLCYTRLNWKTHMVRDSLLYALALLYWNGQEVTDRVRERDGQVAVEDFRQRTPDPACRAAQGANAEVP